VDTKASTEDARRSLKHINRLFTHMPQFSERCSKIEDLKAQVNQLGLTRIHLHKEYFEQAIKCFHKHLPIPCIVVSSALVERTLFWWKINLKPLRAGKTFRYGANLGKLFKEFADWDILQNSLLDADERLNLKLMKERKTEESDTKKIQKWDRKIENISFKAHYVETRNLFAHGKELLLPMPLTQLLPADAYAQSEYGISSEEWWSPTVTTIAYVHLSKTLRFMKAFTDYHGGEEL